MLDKKNWGKKVPGLRLEGRRGANGEYIETEAEKQDRLEFERSHSFYKGQKVLIIKHYDFGYDFYGHIAEVTRVKTEPGSGPCIRVTCGGVGNNIWNPDEMLLPLDEICELLYA